VSSQIDGFYAAYFTSREMNGFAILAMRNGMIAGADQSGTLFDGQYQLTSTGSHDGQVTVNLPANGNSIQGVKTGSDGMSYTTEMSLPTDFLQRQFVRLDTPLGPVNMKLVRLRDINV
jgi:hypothetical protein